MILKKAANQIKQYYKAIAYLPKIHIVSLFFICTLCMYYASQTLLFEAAVLLMMWLGASYVSLTNEFEYYDYD